MDILKGGFDLTMSRSISRLIRRVRSWNSFKKLRNYTMIPYDTFSNKLELCHQFKNIPGCVVECGVWRGGMIAGISRIFGDSRKYILFDSFEGLPDAQEIDGKSAINWQANKEAPDYFDNCFAEKDWVMEALNLSKISNYELVEGWFNKTIPGYSFDDKIAILHLDGDWYDSTKICLDYLFPKVNTGGLILIDDYLIWDGCSRAVHDFLSENKRPEKINLYNGNTIFIVKE